MKERTLKQILEILSGHTSMNRKHLATELNIKCTTLNSCVTRNTIPYQKINLYCLKYDIDFKFAYFIEPPLATDGFNQSDIYEVMDILKDIEDAK